MRRVKRIGRVGRTIRNLCFVAAALLLISFPRGLHLTADNAYAVSERTAHYGPSIIEHTIDWGNRRFYLAHYDKWFSCNPVKRQGLFWSLDNSTGGMENQPDRPLVWDAMAGWRDVDGGLRIQYGMRNDRQIASVGFVFRNGEERQASGFYGDMFYLQSPLEWEEPLYIQAYDKNGALLYTLTRYGLPYAQ